MSSVRHFCNCRRATASFWLLFNIHVSDPTVIILAHQCVKEDDIDP